MSTTPEDGNDAAKQAKETTTPVSGGFWGWIGKSWGKKLLELEGGGFLVALATLVVTVGFGSHFWNPPSPLGQCQIRPPSDEDQRTLLVHVNNGLRYKSDGQWKAAQAEFAEVLQKDQHFIGANLDEGVTYLEQQEYDDARKSFNSELNNVNCLMTVEDKDIPQLAYMLNSDLGIGRAEERTKGYKQRLESIEAAAHYDLACAWTKQNNFDEALHDLTLAAHNCLIKPAAWKTDTDLNALRQARRTKFEEIVKTCQH